MGWKRTAFDRFSRTLQRAARARHYPNFAWVMQWDVTYVCPLTCSYCLVPHLKDHGDSRRALAHVLELRPKYLIITGGEPILEPNIVPLARAVKEAYNPLVMMTTSLMGPESTLSELLPWVDNFHVSLDGLGEVNKANRGYSGAGVLRRLEFLVREIAAAGRHNPVITLCVLTPHNYRHVRELVERVAEIDPNILVTFCTVEPQTHPMSLVHFPEIVEELLPVLWELRERYNVGVVGPLGTRAMRTHKGNATPAEEPGPGNGQPGSYYCPRQYFRVMMDPDGNLRSCKDGRLLEHGLWDMESALTEGRYRDAGRALWYLLDILFLHPHSADCRYPCKCEEFVDDIIMNREGEPVLHETHMLAGRFSSAELDLAERYIRRHFNPRWNPATRALLERKE